MKPLEYAEGNIETSWPEASELILRNNEETGFWPKEEFNPQVDKYKALEAADILHLYTARNDGALVGYGVFIVMPHLVYPRFKMGIQEYFFLDKEHRANAGGFKFLQYTEFEIKKLGCDFIVRLVSQLPNAPDYSDTLLSLGYQPLENSFIKKL